MFFSNTIIIRVILFSVSFFGFIELKSQNTYSPLMAVGELPDDFLKLSKEKYYEEYAAAKKESSYRELEIKRQFLLFSNYLIDDLLMSGKILFGDEVTNYVQKVGEKVIGDNKFLQSHVRFYVVKSGAVNAFTTNSGIVFVTLGLLAEIENEAQLAYILAHELTHFTEKHVIDGYIYNNKVFNNRNRYQYNTHEDKIKRASTFSKSMEFEADSLGFLDFAKTGYSLEAAISSMDILQFSHLPFDDKIFKYEFLENRFVKIPKEYMLDSILAPELNSDSYDDSKSTHPNIKSRRKALMNLFDIHYTSEKKGQLFLVSEKDFFNVQLKARLECIRILIASMQYAEAIYECQVLQEMYSDKSYTEYFEISIAKALYGIAKYKLYNKYNKIDNSIGDYEGQIQNCISLFKNIENGEVGFIAANYIYKIAEKYQNKFIKELRNDLFITLINHQNVDFVELKQTSLKQLDEEEKEKKRLAIIEEQKIINKILTDSLDKSGILYSLDSLGNVQLVDTTKKEIEYVEIKKDSAVTNPTKLPSKYDKFRLLKTEKKENHSSVSLPYIKMTTGRYSFIDSWNDEKFNEFIDSIVLVAAEIKLKDKEEALLDDGLTDYEKRLKERMLKKERNKEGLYLGIDSVIISDPFYYGIDKYGSLKLEESETKLVNFANDISTTSKMANLYSTLICSKTYDKKDIDNYNSLSQLNMWIQERMNIENLDMIPLETEYSQSLIDQYNTPYVVFTGVFNYREAKEYIGLALLSVITIYTSPIGLIYLIRPNEYTYHYTLLFDLRDGVCYMNNVVAMNTKDNRGILKSQLYDVFNQINRTKK